MTAFRLRPDRAQPESQLQRQVAAMLRAYLPDEVFWTASLSGIRLTPGTANQAKLAGMNRGAPDLSFIWPDGSTSYIELKAKTGTLSPEQYQLSKCLAGRFALCRSWAEVREKLEFWMWQRGLAFLTERESLKRESLRRGTRGRERAA